MLAPSKLGFQTLNYVPVLSFWSETKLFVDRFMRMIKSTLATKKKEFLSIVDFLNLIKTNEFHCYFLFILLFLTFWDSIKNSFIHLSKMVGNPSKLTPEERMENKSIVVEDISKVTKQQLITFLMDFKKMNQQNLSALDPIMIKKKLAYNIYKKNPFLPENQENEANFIPLPSSYQLIDTNVEVAEDVIKKFLNSNEPSNKGCIELVYFCIQKNITGDTLRAAAHNIQDLNPAYLRILNDTLLDVIELEEKLYRSNFHYDTDGHTILAARSARDNFEAYKIKLHTNLEKISYETWIKLNRKELEDTFGLNIPCYKPPVGEELLWRLQKLFYHGKKPLEISSASSSASSSANSSGSSASSPSAISQSTPPDNADVLNSATSGSNQEVLNALNDMITALTS